MCKVLTIQPNDKNNIENIETEGGREGEKGRDLSEKLWRKRRRPFRKTMTDATKTFQKTRTETTKTFQKKYDGSDEDLSEKLWRKRRRGSVNWERSLIVISEHDSARGSDEDPNPKPNSKESKPSCRVRNQIQKSMNRSDSDPDQNRFYLEKLGF